MHAKATEAFRDSLTWELRAPGEHFEADAERVASLCALGLAVAADEQVGGPDESGEDEGGLEDLEEEGELEDLSVAELREVCAERGVEAPKKATRAQLIALLGE